MSPYPTGPLAAPPHPCQGATLMPNPRRIEIKLVSASFAVANSADTLVLLRYARVFVVVFVSFGALSLASLVMVLAEGVFARGDGF
jgi:hypothetical protein